MCHDLGARVSEQIDEVDVQVGVEVDRFYHNLSGERKVQPDGELHPGQRGFSQRVVPRHVGLLDQGCTDEDLHHHLEEGQPSSGETVISVEKRK